jgi:hypothetical protein
MKRCPTCERTYTDDALSFCPSDGTPLVGDAPSSSFDPQATIMASPPKVSTPSGPFDQPTPSDWSSPEQSGWQQQQQQQQQSKPNDWGSPGGYQPISPPMGGTGFQPPPPPPFPGAANKQQGLSIASMVCGILSIVCCLGVFTGVPAIVLGIMGMNKEKADPAHYGGRGMALAGVITGGIGSLFGAIWLILQIIGLLMRH